MIKFFVYITNTSFIEYDYNPNIYIEFNINVLVLDADEDPRGKERSPQRKKLYRTKLRAFSNIKKKVLFLVIHPPLPHLNHGSTPDLRLSILSKKLMGTPLIVNIYKL